MRGFKYRSVSPYETGNGGLTYEPVGGDTYWFASAEYSIPIIERLRIAFFYDMGLRFFRDVRRVRLEALPRYVRAGQ